MWFKLTISNASNFPTILEAARSTSISPGHIVLNSCKSFLAAEAVLAAEDDVFFVTGTSFEFFQPDCIMVDRLCDAALTARIVDTRVSIVSDASCVASLSVVAAIFDGCFVDVVVIGRRRRVDWGIEAEAIITTPVANLGRRATDAFLKFARERRFPTVRATPSNQ